MLSRRMDNGAWPRHGTTVIISVDCGRQRVGELESGSYDRLVFLGCDVVIAG